ncbi:MAG: ABC transporter ATP-binding protein, partial [Candidatus Thorarchaeota archaeon]
LDLKTKKRFKSGNHLFFAFITKHPFLVIFSLIMSAFSALTLTLPSVFTGQALDILANEHFNRNFIINCILIFSSGLAYLGSTFLASYGFGVTAFAYERDIRQEFFDTIQNNSLTFHDSHNASKLLSMGVTEVQQMRFGLHPSMRMVTQAVFSIILAIYILFSIDWIQGLVMTVGSLIYFYFVFVYSKKVAIIRTQRADSIGTLTEDSQEIFRGIEVVRELSAESREKEKFNHESLFYKNILERENKLQAFYYPTLILLLITVVIFAICVFDVNNRLISIGALITALALLLSLQRINQFMPRAALNIQAGLTNASRIWEILNWHDPHPDNTFQFSNTVNWRGDICFKNVSFSYDSTGNKKALKNISLTIPGGSRVALIGGPGSGKSTFLKLLLRLYDPETGSIKIDNKPLTEISSKELRIHVSRVEQEIFLFTGTIKDNIKFSKQDASDEDIFRAAQTVQADEFIQEMPQKYDSMIGERGITLSGGQRQRIAIARALLANPEILLLDDSVSAVDSKTEMLLRKALDNLMVGRTSITVTQRLNTLVTADLIILLERGELVASGTHQILLKTCRQYRRIFELLPENERISAGINNKGDLF